MSQNDKSGKKLLIALISGPTHENALIEQGWDFAQNVFKQFGRRIEKGSYGFKSKSQKLKDHKLYDFRRSKRTVLSEMEESNINRVTLYSLLPGCAQVMFDWSLIIEFGNFARIGLDVLQVGIDQSVIKENGIEDYKTLLWEICSRMFEILPAAGYGFASIMPYEYLPIGYVAGLAGGAPENLIYDVNSWGDGYGTGLDTLRNVHGWNLLAKGLLNQPVDDTTLEHWITRGKGKRGELQEFSESLALWSFANLGSDTEVLDWDGDVTGSIRRELENKKLFPWQAWLNDSPAVRRNKKISSVKERP